MELLSEATKVFRFQRSELSNCSKLEKFIFKFKYQFQPYYFVYPPNWRKRLRLRNWKDRVVPGFASLGAVRSGTSALSELIFQHPAVTLPLAKEIQGDSTSIIRAHFPTKKQTAHHQHHYGQAISGYCSPHVPDIATPYLLKELSPSIKIILILRDPVDRTISHFYWDQKKIAALGASPDSVISLLPPFFDRVRIESESIAQGGGGFPVYSGPVGIVQASIYLPFVNLILELFDNTHVKIINASDFFDNPTLTAKDIYDFLDLRPYEPVPISGYNSAFEKPPEDTELRKYLSDFFRPYNEQLYDLIDRDMGWN